MTGEEIDVRITMEVQAWNTNSKHFTVAIEVNDASEPPIFFESLQRFEKIVHDALVEQVLGIKESRGITRMIEFPRHPVLKSEHKNCYNTLSGEPKQ